MTFKLLYRVGQAKQRGHLKTPADHRNGEECQGWACPKANGKDDIKCTLQADHGNAGIGRLRE